MIDSIKKLLRETYWTSIENNEELLKDSQSGMQVTVSQLSNNGLKISIPKQKAHMGIINETKGYKQSCDYLILIPSDDYIDVYFIEMKETLNFNENHIPEIACNQILRTVPIFDYLISMEKTHFPHQKKKKIHRYFVVIGQKLSEKLDKQKVRPEKFKKHNYNNEKFKIIYSSPSIPLAHLK